MSGLLLTTAYKRFYCTYYKASERQERIDYTSYVLLKLSYKKQTVEL